DKGDDTICDDITLPTLTKGGTLEETQAMAASYYKVAAIKDRCYTEVAIKIWSPSACNDKIETMDMAKEIGTYDASCGPELCALFGPKHPATSSTIPLIEREEEQLDIPKMVEEALSTQETLN
ncbi:hypothetical protein ACFL96_17780, partial [Thermoproteota archaeon]